MAAINFSVWEESGFLDHPRKLLKSLQNGAKISIITYTEYKTTRYCKYYLELIFWLTHIWVKSRHIWKISIIEINLGQDVLLWNRSCLFSLKINMQMGCRCQEALQSFVQIRFWHLTKQFLLVFIGVFCTNGFCQGYSWWSKREFQQLNCYHFFLILRSYA